MKILLEKLEREFVMTFLANPNIYVGKQIERNKDGPFYIRITMLSECWKVWCDRQQ